MSSYTVGVANGSPGRVALRPAEADAQRRAGGDRLLPVWALVAWVARCAAAVTGILRRQQRDGAWRIASRGTTTRRVGVLTLSISRAVMAWQL